MKCFFPLHWIVRRLGLALALAAAAWPGLAQEVNADQTVSLNFVNADIPAVIQAVSKLSGRNFVVDPRVKGNINIVTARPVPRATTYSILASALRLQGYAVVEGKGVTQVVPEADAKLHAGPVNAGRRVDEDNSLVTQVFTLKHESAAQVVPVIRPLVAANNTVTAYPGNNSLVVTDYAENVRRIAQIIESIDVPQDGVRVFPLAYMSAVDLAATINRLMNESGGSAGDASQKVSVVADTRSNSLLVRSDNLSKIAAVRQLVAALDVPAAAGNIHVIYLKNAEAAKVAQTLRSVLSGDTSAPASSAASSFSTGSTPTSSNVNSTTPTSGLSSANGTTPTGGGIVQADPMTNSLIVTAPEAVYNNLRRVVDQLDRRRAQVYVEALITEISAETAAEFGIQWQTGKLSNANGVVGGTNFGTGGANIINLASGSSSASPGMNLILGGGTVSVLGKDMLNLNMLARFLQSDTKANILSTPNLITLDNEEAKMVVGQNLPFVTGQYTNTGGGTNIANPFQTIERKDVGLTLKVKPQISEGGTVRLQIYQEASSVVASSATSAYGPITNKRSIESTVLVDDGAIIALGGLIEDSYSAGADRVPMLGDIPYLGSLFRYDTRKRSKTNLIVFLRPVILRDGDSAQGLSDQRYDYIIGQQRQADQAKQLLRGEAALPELPPRGQPAPALPHYPAAAATLPAAGLAQESNAVAAP